MEVPAWVLRTAVGREGRCRGERFSPILSTRRRALKLAWGGRIAVSRPQGAAGAKRQRQPASPDRVILAGPARCGEFAGRGLFGGVRGRVFLLKPPQADG